MPKRYGPVMRATVNQPIVSKTFIAKNFLGHVVVEQ